MEVTPKSSKADDQNSTANPTKVVVIRLNKENSTQISSIDSSNPCYGSVIVPVPSLSTTAEILTEAEPMEADFNSSNHVFIGQDMQPYIKLEVIDDSEEIMEVSQPVISSQRQLRSSSQSSPKSTDTVFISLEDLFTKFMQYQLSQPSRKFNWVLTRNSQSKSLFLYNASKPSEIGYLSIEVTPVLKVKMLVFGNYINEEHSIALSHNFPNKLTDMKGLLSFLNFINMYRLCLGNDESEMLELSNREDTNGFFNRYTNALHSKECQCLYKQSNSNRCKNCTAFRNNLQKKIKRSEKSTDSQTTKKGVNVRFMSKNDQSEALKKSRDEKKNLKTQIKRLKIKIEKLELKMKKRSDTDIFAGIKDANFSKDNFLQLLMKQHLQLRKANKTRPRTWHPSIIKWCLNFNSVSAAAYEALRNVITLPSARTLFNYSPEFPLKRGFSDTILNDMRQKIDLDQVEEHQKYFALVVDEMKANTTADAAEEPRESEEEDDGGVRNLSDSRIMVLMVQGLTTNFKHILAYFPCHRMNAGERYGILQDAIERLENNGFKILTVICDNSAINQKTIKLSADSIGKNGVPYKCNNPFAPRNDQRDLYYICDPPTLIKMVRNGLYHSGANKYHFLYQKNGKYMLWAHIREMYKKDNLARIRLCPKLTTNHIKVGYLYSQRVNLAVQVLSNSVANAIETYIGEDASETVKFVRYFNQFFDILSTRKYAAGKSNRNCNLDPFMSGEDWRFKWLEEEFIGYLLQWKTEVEQADVSPEEKKRMFMSKETLEPIILSVHSIIGAVNFLLSKGANIVFTDKFNRDLLEHRYGKYTKSDGNQ